MSTLYTVFFPRFSGSWGMNRAKTQDVGASPSSPFAQMVIKTPFHPYFLLMYAPFNLVDNGDLWYNPH
jgi:hypothetical protein